MNDDDSGRGGDATATRDETHELSAGEIERLAGLGCTVEEAAAWFDLTPEEMRARLAEPGLERAWMRGWGRGRVRLRQIQFDMANSHQGMAIHLGRCVLGQTDAHGDRDSNVTLVVETGIDRGHPPDG